MSPDRARYNGDVAPQFGFAGPNPSGTQVPLTQSHPCWHSISFAQMLSGGFEQFGFAGPKPSGTQTPETLHEHPL